MQIYPFKHYIKLPSFGLKKNESQELLVILIYQPNKNQS